MSVSTDDFIPFSANRSATYTFICALYLLDKRIERERFEISTGADLTLVENTDDANGRRTKELGVRYDPPAVKDYEWLD